MKKSKNRKPKNRKHAGKGRQKNKVTVNNDEGTMEADLDTPNYFGVGRNSSKSILTIFLICFFLCFSNLESLFSQQVVTTHGDDVPSSESPDILDVISSSSISLMPPNKSPSQNTNDSICLEESVLLTPECMNLHARSIARAFPDRPKDSWCVPTLKRGKNSTIKKKWQGLLMAKVPKAASSTSAGVTLRIHNYTGCEIQWLHRIPNPYGKRTKQSFLFASIREPASRDLSHVQYFIFSHYKHLANNHNETPSEDFFINKGLEYRNKHSLNHHKGRGGFQYKWLSTETIPINMIWSEENENRVIDPQNVHRRLQKLLHSYDFLMVVERIDESLVALAMITGLDLSNVLLTSAAKAHGGYNLARYGRRKGNCEYGRNFPIPNGVYTNYLQSKRYLARTYADQIIHRAANYSLDMTIERLGRDRFQNALLEYKSLKVKAQQYCGERLGSGCTTDGKKIIPVEPCYDRDFGCGYKCVDEMLQYHSQGG